MEPAVIILLKSAKHGESTVFSNIVKNTGITYDTICLAFITAVENNRHSIIRSILDMPVIKHDYGFVSYCLTLTKDIELKEKISIYDVRKELALRNGTVWKCGAFQNTLYSTYKYF